MSDQLKEELPGLATHKPTEEEAVLWNAVLKRVRLLKVVNGIGPIFRNVTKQRELIARISAAGRSAGWIETASADELASFFDESTVLPQIWDERPTSPGGASLERMLAANYHAAAATVVTLNEDGVPAVLAAIPSPGKQKPVGNPAEPVPVPEPVLFDELTPAAGFSAAQAAAVDLINEVVAERQETRFAARQHDAITLVDEELRDRDQARLNATTPGPAVDAAPTPAPETRPARNPQPSVRDRLKSPGLASKASTFWRTATPRDKAYAVASGSLISTGAIWGGALLLQGLAGSLSPDAPQVADVSTVSSTASTVVVTAPDGVPMPASEALTTKDSIPQRFVVDGDGATGDLPPGAVGVHVTDSEGVPLPAPRFAPNGTYAKVVDLVMNDEEISDDQKRLYKAALNRKIVETAAPAEDLQVLVGNIWNTPEALSVIREYNEQWGGWERTWLIVDQENADRAATGADLIDTPSEYFDFLGDRKGVFPNAKALARKARQDSSLIHDARVVKDLREVETRLSQAEGQAETLKLAFKDHPPQAPQDYLLDIAPAQMGSIYDAPDALIRSGAQNALARNDDAQILPVASEKSEVRGVEVPSDPYDVPESQLAQAQKKPASMEVAPANARLAAIADWMGGSAERLLKTARGRNRERLPAFLAATTADLRALAARFDTLSPSGQEVGLLDVKKKYFERMTDKDTGLVAGDGAYRAELYAAHSRNFLSQLAELLPPVPEASGVDGIQNRVNEEIRATLTKPKEKTFRNA